MENAWDESLPLIAELMNCRDSARQLKCHLDQPCPSFSECKLALQRILNSVENSISLATSNNVSNTTVAGAGCQKSASQSPASGNSREIKDKDCREKTNKRRKGLPKWTRQIQVSPGMGSECYIADKYSWRKYGQKIILGASYPRAYFRCTHQKTQGCLATKQVQQSDENPAVFDIIYHGEHTCRPNQPMITTTTSEPTVGDEDHVPNDLLQSYKTGLKVKTTNLGNHEPDFSFPTTPIYEPTTSENHIFSIDKYNFVTGSNSNISPFISPSASESNYVPVSRHDASSFGGALCQLTSHSELTKIISSATSTSDSHMVGLELQPEFLEFKQEFPFFDDHLI